MKYIDIHCHLNFEDYENDREEVIGRAKMIDAGIINVGTDVSTSKKAIELGEKYENMWATVAIHPNHAKDDFDLALIKELASNPKVVAIGECGLDYFHSEKEDMIKQKEIFIQHIMIANELNKPLMLHIRNGKGENGAYREAVEILKTYSKVRSNFHFFAGTVDDLKLILDMNGTVSFTGVVTFTNDYNRVVEYVPKGSIMSETDAPYVAPIPYRGKRNEPSYIKEISHKIGEIRGVDNFSDTLVDNAREMFRIQNVIRMLLKCYLDVISVCYSFIATHHGCQGNLV